MLTAAMGEADVFNIPPGLDSELLHVTGGGSTCCAVAPAVWLEPSKLCLSGLEIHSGGVA